MGTPSDLSKGDLQRRELIGYMNQNVRRKGLGCGCLQSIVGLIGFLVLGSAFLIGFDGLVAPWAWGWFGRSTLTGEWVGTFKLPAGQRGAAYLNLSHNPNDDFRGSRQGPNLPRLQGTAQGCFSASAIQNYTVDGGASSGGDNIVLGFAAQKPTVPNYALQDLKGAWDKNNLTLSGTFTTILDTKGSTLLKSEPNQTQPTTIVFSKGNVADFKKACQSFGQ